MRTCSYGVCRYPSRNQDDVGWGTMCAAHYNGGPGNNYGNPVVLLSSVLTPAPKWKGGPPRITRSRIHDAGALMVQPHAPLWSRLSVTYVRGKKPRVHKVHVRYSGIYPADGSKEYMECLKSEWVSDAWSE